MPTYDKMLITALGFPVSVRIVYGDSGSYKIASDLQYRFNQMSTVTSDFDPQWYDAHVKGHQKWLLQRPGERKRNQPPEVAGAGPSMRIAADA